MSGNKNPFLDDDEVDDYEFLRHHPQGQSGYLLGNDSNSQAKSDLQLRQKLLMEERRRIEERTLQSAQTSMRYIYESEKVGIDTAEELVRQREQLQNIDRNLDTINNAMRVSQRHINSIKSVFGGVKSFFSGSRASDPSKTNIVVSPTAPQPSKLQDTVGGLKETQVDYNTPHPALRTRGISYEEAEGDEADFVKVECTSSVPSTKNTAQTFDDKLDENLEDISMGLGRLKHLAIGLHDEIADHNVMLDRMYTKADHADETLEYQNRQIKRILKK